MVQRALIVGGGIAGLTAAVALQRAKYDVSVFERADEILPMGAAISVWNNACQALANLGLADALKKCSHEIRKTQILSDKGALFSNIVLSDDDVSAFGQGVMIRRSALQSMLVAGIEGDTLCLGKEFSHYQQQDGAVIVHFTDGSAEKGDLLIFADGIWSKSMADIDPKSSVYHAGYGGMLAITKKMDDMQDDHAVREYWGRGQRFGICDISENQQYWFYMRNEKSSEETSKSNLNVIRDQLSDWPSLVQKVMNNTDAEKLIPFSIHARSAPNAMSKGRVIAIGDACHAMEPNLGQGACQSIEDGYAIGIAASYYDVDDVAAAFQRMRLKRARKFVKNSAMIGSASKYQSSILCAGRSFVMKMTPDALTKTQMTQNNSLPDYEAMLGIGK